MTIFNRVPSGIRSLFAAAFGFLASILLWFIFGVVSSLFRGPVLEWNELGGPIYEDLTANQLITGVAYLGVSVVISVSLRDNLSSALIAGFMFGAVILG